MWVVRGAAARLFWRRLEYALQRVPGAASDLHHLVRFGLGYVAGVNAAYAPAFCMHLVHDAGGGIQVFVEKLLQHQHDKFHGSEVVVDQHHLVHGWWFDGLQLGFDRCFGCPTAIVRRGAFGRLAGGSG